MVQTLLASNVTLRDLRQQFGLQPAADPNFFPEWASELPALSATEKLELDRIQQGYLNLAEDPPLLEKTVQLAILGPLLLVGGFYLPPFRIKLEQSVEITAEDEETVIRGQLDILLLKEEFWLMVIESKHFSFSVEAGLSQLLSYMLATPHPNRPCFGMVSTGGTFTFIKLVQERTPQYAISREFTMRNPGNELYQVLQILKKIAEIT